jgi:tryptophanyl-tRNA synthetase
MSKPVILTGLRANNDLHIGNYFGALLPIVDMAVNRAGEYQVNLFVPDLHSFTTPIDHTKLYDQILHNLKLFVAAGLPLDNADVHIYRQSFIPAHSELTVMLNSFTGFGEMSRMTQFKDKSTKLSSDRVSVGLFDYPVLMAADILLYDTKYVPVGDDQSQHIEFARDIAQRMNSQFGDLFVIPESVQKQHEFFGKDQGLRIKDLQVPTNKMSKSDVSGKGIIFLSDDPKDAAKKILSATTDNIGEIKFDPKNQPGIANLLQILTLLKGSDIVATIKSYEGKSQYSDLKKDVSAALEDFLTDFQRKLNEVDTHAIEMKLKDSEAKMNIQANQKLMAVQKALGLRR